MERESARLVVESLVGRMGTEGRWRARAGVVRDVKERKKKEAKRTRGGGEKRDGCNINMLGERW